MRRRALLHVLAMLLASVVLCSCELAYKAPEVGRMNILVYGNDYGYDYDGDYGSIRVYYSDGVYYGSGKELGRTVNDAVMVGNVLSKLADKAEIEHRSIFMIGKTNTYDDKILDSDAVISHDMTVNGFKMVLEDLISSARQKDITLIYFSGHGCGSSNKSQYGVDTAKSTYLVLDQNAGDDYELFLNSEFLELVDMIPGTKVIISDCCHSGGLVQSGYVSLTGGEYSDMDIKELYNCRNRISEYSSLFCLSAARYYELSYENKPLHGNFTNALLDAFGWDESSMSLTTAQAERNGRITLFNVAKYCIENDDNAKQTPMLSGGSNDVILFSF